jgi:DNA polymerase/3'-5' exonuclease PolX
MSQGPGKPYAQMRKIAEGLVERMAPACHRIQIVGSIRRRRNLCSDIELLAIPISLQDGFFGTPPLGEPTALGAMVRSWPVEWVKSGDRYKQFRLTTTAGSVYTVDLWLATPATWGVKCMIRTGSAEFSTAMVTPRRLHGLMPDQFRIRDGRVWLGVGQAAIDTPEEADVFRLWGLETPDPAQRTGEYARRLADSTEVL